MRRTCVYLNGLSDVATVWQTQTPVIRTYELYGSVHSEHDTLTPNLVTYNFDKFQIRLVDIIVELIVLGSWSCCRCWVLLGTLETQSFFLWQDQWRFTKPDDATNSPQTERKWAKKKHNYDIVGTHLRHLRYCPLHVGLWIPGTADNFPASELSNVYRSLFQCCAETKWLAASWHITVDISVCLILQ